MKYALAMTCLLLAAGCVSAPEHDRSNAYAKCKDIKVVTSRDRCIAEAVRTSERQRQDQAREQA